MRKILATAATVIGLAAFSAPAGAVVSMYQFNLDGTGGAPLPAGPYGTVNLNDNGGTTSWHFDIQLQPNFYFNDSKAFQAFDLLLSGTGIGFSNITTGFTAAGLGSYTAPNIVTNGDATDFNYALLCADLCAGGKTNGTISDLSFDVTGTGLTLGNISDTHNYPGVPIYFAADISYAGVTPALTGNVGATLTSAIPEPSTWALFILGFGGIGLMMRSNRRRSAILARLAA